MIWTVIISPCDVTILYITLSKTLTARVSIVLALKEFLRELLKIQVITFSTQKLMTYTEWKGAPSTSLDDYIQTAGIDQSKCKTACLKDVSKICSKDVDGEEMLSVFFKCPSWEDTQGPAYYCQQQLEGNFLIHSKLNFPGRHHIQTSLV